MKEGQRAIKRPTRSPTPARSRREAVAQGTDDEGLKNGVGTIAFALAVASS